MDFTKTPRHNKVRHNMVMPMSEEVKRKIIPPVTSWIDPVAAAKWTEQMQQSRRSSFTNNAENSDNEENNTKQKVQSINLAQIHKAQEEGEGKEEEDLPGKLNTELEEKEKVVKGDEKVKSPRSPKSPKSPKSALKTTKIKNNTKTNSTTSLISTDVETSSVDSTPPMVRREFGIVGISG